MLLRRVLLTFVGLFPILIWPWGQDINSSLTRLGYLGYFTVVFWLILLLWMNRMNVRPKVDRIHYLLLAYAGIILLSTFFSVDWVQSVFGGYRRYEGLIALLTYLSLFFFSTLWLAKFHLVIDLFLAGSIVSSIYGILQYWGFEFLPRAEVAANWKSSFSFFGNPNFFGSYLVLMLMLAVGMWLGAHKRWHHWFYLLTSILVFAALVYTRTRGAWLGALAGLVFIGWFCAVAKMQMKRYLLLLFIFACVFGVVNLLDNNAFLARFFSIGSDLARAIEGDGGAGASRWYLWQNSLHLIPRYFWLGSGPDTFGKVFNAHFHHKYFDKAHNEYLQIVITMGTPALLVYLALVATALRNGWRAMMQSRGSERFFCLAVVAGVFGYLVQAFFNISVVSVAPFFWVLLGICHVLDKEEHHIFRAV